MLLYRFKIALTSFYSFIKKTILLNQKKVCFYLFIKKYFFTRTYLYISFFLFVFCLLTFLFIFVKNNY